MSLEIKQLESDQHSPARHLYGVYKDGARIGGFTLGNPDRSGPDFDWFFDKDKAEMKETEFLSEIFGFLRAQGYTHIVMVQSEKDYSGWFDFILMEYDNAGWEPAYDIYRCLYDFEILEDRGNNDRVYCLEDPDNGAVLCAAHTYFECPDWEPDGAKAFYFGEIRVQSKVPGILSQLLYNCELKAADAGIRTIRYIVPDGDPMNDYCARYENKGQFVKDGVTYTRYEKTAYHYSYRQYE